MLFQEVGNWTVQLFHKMFLIFRGDRRLRKKLLSAQTRSRSPGCISRDHRWIPVSCTRLPFTPPHRAAELGGKALVQCYRRVAERKTKCIEIGSALNTGPSYSIIEQMKSNCINMLFDGEVFKHTATLLMNSSVFHKF